MRTIKQSMGWTVLTIALLFLAAPWPPAVAGRVGIGDENQSDPQCDPKEDNKCEGSGAQGSSGGPTICPIDHETDGASLAFCIQATVVNGGGWADFELGGGEAVVEMYANAGSGSQPPQHPVEVESYCFRENTDVVQFVDIEIDRPNLVAKISNFVEGPTSEGTITIKVNHTGLVPMGGFDTVVVDTATVAGRADRLNWKVCQALKGAGLTVDCLENFFVIRSDSRYKSPRQVSILVDDPDLESLEIALEPGAGYSDITACSDVRPIIAPFHR